MHRARAVSFELDGGADMTARGYLDSLTSTFVVSEHAHLVAAGLDATVALADLGLDEALGARGSRATTRTAAVSSREMTTKGDHDEPSNAPAFDDAPEDFHGATERMPAGALPPGIHDRHPEALELPPPPVRSEEPGDPDTVGDIPVVPATSSYSSEDPLAAAPLPVVPRTDVDLEAPRLAPQAVTLPSTPASPALDGEPRRTLEYPGLALLRERAEAAHPAVAAPPMSPDALAFADTVVKAPPRREGDTLEQSGPSRGAVDENAAGHGAVHELSTLPPTEPYASEPSAPSTAPAEGRTAFDALNPYGELAGGSPTRGQVLVVSLVVVVALAAIAVVGGLWAREALARWRAAAVSTTTTTTAEPLPTTTAPPPSTTATPPTTTAPLPATTAPLPATTAPPPTTTAPLPTTTPAPPPARRPPPPPVEPRALSVFVTTPIDKVQADGEDLGPDLAAGFRAAFHGGLPEARVGEGRARHDDVTVRLVLSRLKLGKRGKLLARCAASISPSGTVPGDRLDAEAEAEGEGAARAAARRCGGLIGAALASVAQR